MNMNKKFSLYSSLPVLAQEYLRRLRLTDGVARVTMVTIPIRDS